MINASKSFVDAMTSPIVESYVKLELLDRNENHIRYIEQKVSSNNIGDISVDSSRDIRRMFTITLDNSSGEFTWSEGGLIWIDNKLVKLYIGLKTSSGVIEYVPQGVFVVTQPDAIHKPNTNTVTINGQDRWTLLTGNFGRFTHITTVGKGTKISEAIKIIATNAGITKMIIDDAAATLPYDLTFQIGSNRGQALKDLAAKAFTSDDRAFEIFFDVNGYLRFTPVKDPKSEAPVWSYKIDNNTLYAGSVRKLDDAELFNHIIVTGGSSNTAEFRTEIIVTEANPKWSNSPYSIEKIGDRMFPYNDGNPDSNIDTQSQCDARANFELKKRLQYTDKTSMDLAPNYLHEANDIIEIIDPSNGVSGNYQLKSFTIPIRPKVISAEAWKIREVM
ncbi:hypothetical protein [Paenibacillus chitinolyticus]|uniref:hypothetical protein n=1 Tax=Paenibacillus chitinolyticus TaxID=79263 RepID=UPI003D08391A